MSEVAQIIAEEIRTRGPMTFRRFMELALYCPVCGYYEKEGDNIGAAGDYYTSVSVGSLFGEMLGFQFAEWLSEGKVPMGERRMQIIEGGAHGGKLAADILEWLRRERVELFAGLEYCIVEPSGRRRESQQRRLGDFSGKVRWAGRPSELRGIGDRAGVRGVMFCNELLDAMPVRRLGWDAGRREWFEWGVRMEGGRFGWTRMPAGNGGLVTDDGLKEVLPDGFTLEVGTAAEEWWREAARVLESGRLMTIDYGLGAEELFAPERPEGTLRGYRAHRGSRDVLADPGDQDMTAHVNFGAIRAAGEAAGLKTEAEVTQAQFLTAIAGRIWQGRRSFGEWTAERRRQFQTLTHPEHLGRAFRVLIQRRECLA